MLQTLSVPSAAHRLFFALKPSASVLHTSLFPIWRQARAAGIAPVPLANAHLTLVFIGAVDPGDLDRVRDLGTAVSMPPFEVLLDTVGYWATGGVIWLGATRPPPPLLELAQRLRRSLRQAALPVSTSRFIPHVTLARHAPSPWRGTCALRWSVDRFFLLESVAERGLPRYIVRRRFLLTPATSP